MTDTNITGIIAGAGFMGATHLQCYSNIHGVSIRGIVDTNSEKGKALAAKYPGCTWYPDIDTAVFSCKPDFADICLPTIVHPQAALSALKGGAHILIEKPFAVNPAEASRVLEAAKTAGKRVMVAHVCRFMSEYQYAKSVIESERLGKPLTAFFCRESETPLWSENNWLQNKKSSGGTILDLSIHDIDLANWMFGSPVSYECFERSSPHFAGASHVHSIIGYKNGIRACITANHLMPKGYPLTASYRIVFENGALEWNTVNTLKGHLAEYRENTRKDIALCEINGGGQQDPYQIQLTAFIRCLKSGDSFAISAEEACLAVQTVVNLDKCAHKTKTDES